MVKIYTVFSVFVFLTGLSYMFILFVCMSIHYFKKERFFSHRDHISSQPILLLLTAMIGAIMLPATAPI